MLTKVAAMDRSTRVVKATLKERTEEWVVLELDEEVTVEWPTYLLPPIDIGETLIIQLRTLVE